MKKISEKFGEMTDYTFSSSTGKGDYDLYIWTNGADGRPASGGKTERYPYLMKVQNVHVSEKICRASGQGIHPEGRVQRQ